MSTQTRAQPAAAPAVPAPWMDPYVAGVGIGLVLLAAWVLTGRGLGASGAFSAVVANATVALDAEAATGSAIAPYVQVPLWRDWLVLELVGVAVGAYLSARFAGRLGRSVERGPGVTSSQRMRFALLGGALMAIGAKLARGCTSGQALTGGALLSLGSWTFIATTFAAGYACAPLARRLWR